MAITTFIPKQWEAITSVIQNQRGDGLYAVFALYMSKTSEDGCNYLTVLQWSVGLSAIHTRSLRDWFVCMEFYSPFNTI